MNCSSMDPFLWSAVLQEQAAAMSFYFLKYIVCEALLPSLIGLASDDSVLESAAMGSDGHQGIFWQLLREPTCVSPSLLKPGSTNTVKIQRAQIQGTASKKKNNDYRVLKKHIPILLLICLINQIGFWRMGNAVTLGGLRNTNPRSNVHPVQELKSKCSLQVLHRP